MGRKFKGFKIETTEVPECGYCGKDIDRIRDEGKTLREGPNEMAICDAPYCAKQYIESFSEIEEVELPYSIDCEYYKNKFETLDDLVNEIQNSGMDPNYEIMKNGIGQGETVWDHIGL